MNQITNEEIYFVQTFYFCLSSSPYRAIQALLNGAREMEKTNMARFQEVMRTMQNSASGVSGTSFQQSSPQFIPGTTGCLNMKCNFLRCYE